MGKTLEQVDEAFGDFTGHEEQEVMNEILGSGLGNRKKDSIELS